MQFASITRLSNFSLWMVFALLASIPSDRSNAAEGEWVLHTRSRVRANLDAKEFETQEKTVTWDPKHTAVVICDMWDKHWCPDATERVGELAPVMNRVVEAARQKGMFIIHAPSDTMGFYANQPGRKLAMAAPKVETKVPLQGWCSLQGTHEPPLPIDDSDEGCDGCPDCPGYRAWSRQHPAIEIRDGDAITDSVEAFYLMKQRGITNVIVMGVHENMCVLGRPFSIRQMVAQGQNVVLMRDMTDSMYNHHSRPYVSHFVGTDLVCEHIEKYWCPSITSVDLIGGTPFRFKEDRRPVIALITGENEYHTAETLPQFLNTELKWRGFQWVHVAASSREGDPQFEGYEQIAKADVILLSVRRRSPPKPMMDLIRAHIAAGKPVVGIRTASHSFDTPTLDAAHDSWPSFDDEILGADYQGHYGNKPPKDPPTELSAVSRNAAHPILTGVPKASFQSTSHLYKYRNPAPTVTVLLEGHVQGHSETEPVAWIHQRARQKVFYTSLGNPQDFELPAFRRLLLNGILWSLSQPIPPVSKDEQAALAKKVATPEKPATATPNPSAPPAFATAPEIPQETESAPLSPSEATRRFQVGGDFEWEQVLSEPLIAQPVFLNFDERGRMWVVEYRQYPWPAGLKLLSHDSVFRNVYDKIPEPPPRGVRGADRISIHEDTDGDGIYDKHSVFVDGLNIATAVERGRGGVWVMNPPYLLFYPDRDGNDVPDGDPEVRLSGFGLEDTHSVANSIRWGPDGWLYGAQGSTVTANIWVHGADGKPLNTQAIYSQGQNIWRYHPERRVYEVFCEGGGNAFGCEIDSQGRIFSGHNGGDTRGFHYVQGGYLQKGFEKHGPLSNPYAYGYFPPMEHHSVARFTHTFIIYEGGAFPSQYEGKLFGVEPLQGRIVESERISIGSTFKTRDVDRPVVSQDRWFRPVDIKLGPDGALYVCDWYDQQVNHFRNHEGKMDASNGRVYRLKSRGAKPVPMRDLSRLSVAENVQLLRSSNRWVRQTVQRILADRHDTASKGLLLEGLSRETGQTALESLWALHSAGGFQDGQVVSAGLKHPDPFVRLWTARLLGDDDSWKQVAMETWVEWARKEPNLEVRNQLAATAKRFPAKEGLALVQALIAHDEDAEDSRQPLLLWWAVESKCEQHAAQVVEAFEASDFWTRPLSVRYLLERLMRRLAQSGARRDLLACARLMELSPGLEQTRALVAGFETAFKGKTLSGLPDELLRAMAKRRVDSLALDLRRGDARSLELAIEALKDETGSREDKLEILSILAELRVPSSIPNLIRFFRSSVQDDSLRQAALNALQPYDAPVVAEAVLGLMPKLGRGSLSTAQGLLASRPSWSKLWLQTIQNPKATFSGPSLSRESVPLNWVRKWRQSQDPEMQKMVEALWPNVNVVSTAAMESQIQKLSEILRSGHGNPYSGRTLFQNTCGSCHKLFGQGAEVGPDLTSYKRDDLQTMLLSVVNPNAEVREGYETYSVETKDGRSLNGFLVEQDPQTVVLRGVDGQRLTLNRSDCVELKPAGASLMPEGLLDSMKEQEVRDLFAYLRATQPLVGSAPR